MYNKGDLVAAIPPYHLVCGSGVYKYAVVVQIDPMVLVSESGDMLWRATVKPEKLYKIGVANSRVLDVAMRRFESGH